MTTLNRLILWRTVIAVLLLAGVLLAGLIFCLHSSNPQASAMFPHFCVADIALGGFLASKSLGEKLAGGGGITGAAKALFTAAKPEATPEKP